MDQEEQQSQTVTLPPPKVKKNVAFKEEEKEYAPDSGEPKEKIDEKTESNNFTSKIEEAAKEIDDDDEPVPRTSFSETRLPHHPKQQSSRAKRIGLFALTCINALGVVYGDIGTSPLYVFGTIFAGADVTDVTPERVKGACSLIIYSLTFVVVFKYMIFVMMADFRGAGGVFALVSLLLHKTEKTPKNKRLLGVRGFLPETKKKKHRLSLAELVPGSRRDSVNEEIHVESKDLPRESVDVQQKIDHRNIKVEEIDIELGKDVQSSLTTSMKRLKHSDFLERPSVRTFYSTLALLGAGLLLGDGVITPAISVLSALEGLELLGPSVTPAVVPVTIVILFLLFLMQQLGTAKVGLCFGPIMVLWFFSIGGIGLAQIISDPSGLDSFNPYWAGYFFQQDPGKGWILLGSVVLAVTGCEAMYADMGHLGKNPIRFAWLIYVYPALLLNYTGQASVLISNPNNINNPFYNAVPSPLYFPMIILSTLATIIASQSLISGAFSIVQQAISLGSFPRMKIVHTSSSVEGQIYIPTLNYTLMVVCLILVASFGSSAALSAAYGLAVCGDMTMTSFMFASVSRLRWKWNLFGWIPLITALFFMDLMFLSSTLLKIPNGGYVPLIIASVSFVIMFIWKVGKEMLQKKQQARQIPWQQLEEALKSKQIRRCKGTAVFMTSLVDDVPTTLTDLTAHIPYVHKTVIFLTIEFKHVPNVQHVFIERLPVKGFYRVIAQFGYQVSTVSMKGIFERCNYILPELALDIDNTSFFLGKEVVRSDKKRWFGRRAFVKVFNMMLQIAYSTAASFKIPGRSLVFMGSEVTL